MGRDGEHHALLRTPVFEGAAACQGCHEFAFPDSASSRAPVLMQATIQEHAASARAGERCAECHMPVVRTPAGQHRSHVFAASRDETFVRSAIRVEMAPFEDHTLVLTLHPGAVGHAFPTGDMLRRLRFLVEELDAEGRVIEGEQRLLARHFGFSREPGVVPRRVLRKDDRVGVGPGPVVLRYAVGSLDRAVKLRYSLRYERVSDPIGEDGAAVIDGSVSLAEGTISLQGTPP